MLCDLSFVDIVAVVVAVVVVVVVELCVDVCRDKCLYFFFCLNCI